MSSGQPETETEVAEPAADEAAEATPTARPRFRLLKVLVVGVVGALALALIRGRVIDVAVVQGRSMVPTFRDGTRIFAIQGHYRPGDVKRGDIVLLKDPMDETLVVKRVIATGGDLLEFIGAQVYLNGERLKEPYVNQAEPPRPMRVRFLVPEDSVFVMGDNRNHSQDSRVYGPVRLKQCRARASFVMWPPSEWGKGQR